MHNRRKTDLPDHPLQGAAVKYQQHNVKLLVIQIKGSISKFVKLKSKCDCFDAKMIQTMQISEIEFLIGEEKSTHLIWQIRW